MTNEVYLVRFAKTETGLIFSVIYKDDRWQVHKQVTNFIEGETLDVKQVERVEVL